LFSSPIRTAGNSIEYRHLISNQLPVSDEFLAAVGSHHLEYGFPSTHSTNSVSIALYFFAHVHHLIRVPDSNERISETTYYVTVALLIWYTFSIVFGRLYTAMHSFTDCAVGIALGTGIWALHWAVGKWVDHWICTTGWAGEPRLFPSLADTPHTWSQVPFTVVPLALVMINQHPQPVDDCPCFEDAIAFISVVLGRVLSRWHTVHYGLDKIFFRAVMSGSTWETWEDVGLWWTIAACKMVLGE
jgi:dihydrosphingosine 1-phosphate phosphatase